MPESTDPIVQRLIALAIDPATEEKDLSTHLKSLKTYAEACDILKPELPPEPEPTGVKAFFNRHAGDFIKVGGTLSIVSVIALIEAKGDVIFRSKAATFLK